MKIILILILTSTFVVKASVVFVDKNATGNNDGSSWADAVISISPAVTIAASGDEIHIAQGTYLEGIQIDITKSLSLIGGFSTGGGAQNTVQFETIINGNDSHRVINSHTAGGLTIVLDGLTIRHGNSTTLGGGVLIGTSMGVNTLSINNVQIMSNQTTQYGGGIFVSNTNTSITKSLIFGNTASSISSVDAKGGGIYFENSDLIISNSRILGNKSGSSNTNNSYGAGIYIGDLANVKITNSVINGNNLSCKQACNGLAFASGSDVTLVNSNVTFNTYTSISSVINGSIFMSENTIEFFNSIISHNNFDDIHLENGAVQVVNNSYIRYANPVGNNNIDATVIGFDAGFVGSNISNFHLLSTSILVGAGDDSLLPLDDFDIDNDGDFGETIPLDLDSNLRISGASVDIGAYEFQVLVFYDGFE